SLLLPSRALGPPVPHSFPTRRSSDLSLADLTLRIYLPKIPLVNCGVGGTQAAFRLASSSSDTCRVNSRVVASIVISSPSFTRARSEEHTSELQSRENLVCRLLLEKKK